MAFQYEVNGIVWDAESIKDQYPLIERISAWINQHMEDIASLQGGMIALQNLVPKYTLSINSETIQLISAPGFNISARLLTPESRNQEIGIQIEVNNIEWDIESVHDQYPGIGLEGVIHWIKRHSIQIMTLQADMNAFQSNPKYKISINSNIIELVSSPGFNIVARLIPNSPVEMERSSDGKA